MHSKLNLKVSGINDADDLKLIHDNLKSQPGVGSVKIASFKGYAEIKMEIEDSKISRQQVLDLIKISGDFKIEELDNLKPNLKIEPVEKNQSSTNDRKVASNYFSAVDPSRASFFLGLLIGFSAIAVLAVIFLGYLLIKTSYAQGIGAANITGGQNDGTTLNNQPAQAPSPSPQGAGPIQNFTITKNDHVRGDFNAPVTLVEYSDFQCPYCGKHFPTLNKILTDYPGQVRLVYKHFPLSFHNFAQKAAEASECADEQGKFWAYHDKLFENQASGFSIDNFKQWADDLNLNTSKFNDCLDTGKYASKVQADAADGQNRGVSGTPATFVNGQLVSGAVPYESFKPIIDKLLNK